MGEERLVKSNFIMTITTFTKVNKGEDYTLVKASETISRERGKDFTKSLYEDRSKGLNRKVEVVAAAPKEFVPNVIYIRQDGRRVWIFIIEDSSED